LSGRGLCDELITRPEESYRLCCVVVCDLETSRMGAPYIYDISHLRVKEITKNIHIGHCTHTARNVHVKVTNVFHGRNNITCSTNCKYRTAATPYTVETWFISGTYL